MLYDIDIETTIQSSSLNGSIKENTSCFCVINIVMAHAVTSHFIHSMVHLSQCHETENASN